MIFRSSGRIGGGFLLVVAVLAYRAYKWGQEAEWRRMEEKRRTEFFRNFDKNPEVERLRRLPKIKKVVDSGVVEIATKSENAAGQTSQTIGESADAASSSDALLPKDKEYMDRMMAKAVAGDIDAVMVMATNPPPTISRKLREEIMASKDLYRELWEEFCLAEKKMQEAAAMYVPMFTPRFYTGSLGAEQSLRKIDSVMKILDEAEYHAKRRCAKAIPQMSVNGSIRCQKKQAEFSAGLDATRQALSGIRDLIVLHALSPNDWEWNVDAPVYYDQELADKVNAKVSAIKQTMKEGCL